ncbi:MAG: hypothetical protein WA971_04070 [Microbacterium sp.]
MSLVLRRGSTTAVVDERGATVLSFEHAGRRHLIGPDEAAPDLGHHGAVLAPWPGRLAGAVYEFEGRRRTAPVNDALGHAIHGFAFRRRWQVLSQRDACVSLGVALYDKEVYPFAVELRVRYSLDVAGLRCDAEWVHRGDGVAPFGLGFHPYLSPGGGRVDEWTLTLAAAAVIEGSPQTRLPLPPRGPDDRDFTAGRRVGAETFSRAYGALPRDREGRARLHLSAAGQPSLEMTLSSALGWVQVFTGDNPDPRWHRRGLALEPQTCPADSFNSGRDLLRLADGERGHAWWGVRIV